MGVRSKFERYWFYIKALQYFCSYNSRIATLVSQGLPEDSEGASVGPLVGFADFVVVSGEASAAAEVALVGRGVVAISLTETCMQTILVLTNSRALAVAVVVSGWTHMAAAPVSAWVEAVGSDNGITLKQNPVTKLWSEMYVFLGLIQWSSSLTNMHI